MSPELRVVLDASVLYSGTAHYLVSRQTYEAVGDSTAHGDLCVVWYVPHVVLLERRYQMIDKGERLLGEVRRMEKLVGSTLNVTRETVESCVDRAIDTQLSELGLERLPLAYRDVDWEEVVHKSAARLPPFERGEKEKGFRDAMICESFCQLVEDSPQNPEECVVVLVAGDEVLREVAQERTAGRENVRMFESLEALQGYINTILAEVGEAFVQAFQEQATQYFFTLYREENVWNEIAVKHDYELALPPPGSAIRENAAPFIHRARFERKEKDRVFWSSRISVHAEAFRMVSTFATGEQDPMATGSPYVMPSSSSGSSVQAATWSVYASSVPSGPPLPPLSVTSHRVQRALVARGVAEFDVLWSASLKDDAFKKGKIEEISRVGTEWETV